MIKLNLMGAMRTKILIVAVFIILPLIANAQTQKNTLSIELGGNGFLYSLNYDRLIPISNQFKLAPRVGFEFLPRIRKDKKSFSEKYGNWSFPFEVNLLWAKESHSKNFAEVGLGISLFSMIRGYRFNQNEKITDTYFKMAKVTTLRLGYRHQKPAGGLMYRAGILVRLTQDEFSKSRVGDDLFYVIWPGFSIGYTF